MSADGSDSDDTVEHKPRDPRLIETGELPRAEPTAVEGHKPIDPWSEVTPPVGGSEGEAILVSGDGPTAELDSSANEDGPFAVPLDAPAKGQDATSRAGAPKEAPVARKDDRPSPPSALARSPSRLGPMSSPFPSSIPMSRRVGRAQSGVGTPASTGASPPRKASTARPPAIERRYPKMRALLKNPGEVPHGSEAVGVPAARPPPVPGTFFPAPRREKEVVVPAAPRDLDEMLACMAEGLLVGEGTSGQTEVRVTLRDEFFAGTELRISAGLGMVSAVLMPPDRGTYLMLNAHLDELRERLEARGLQILELRVAEP